MTDDIIAFAKTGAIGPKPAFEWSEWLLPFPGEPDRSDYRVKVCTRILGDERSEVGSIMHDGHGHFSAFPQGHDHWSHLDDEEQAVAVIEHLAGGDTPLLPSYMKIVDSLIGAPRAATEREVKALVKAASDALQIVAHVRCIAPRRVGDWHTFKQSTPPADEPVLVGRFGYRPQMASIRSDLPGHQWPMLCPIEIGQPYAAPTHWAYVNNPPMDAIVDDGGTP